MPRNAREEAERYLARHIGGSRTDYYAVPESSAVLKGSNLSENGDAHTWISPIACQHPENHHCRALHFPCAKGWKAPTVIFLHALMSASDRGSSRLGPTSQCARAGTPCSSIFRITTHALPRRHLNWRTRHHCRSNPHGGRIAWRSDGITPAHGLAAHARMHRIRTLGLQLWRLDWLFAHRSRARLSLDRPPGNPSSI
jgi:hypothetical protein